MHLACDLSKACGFLFLTVSLLASSCGGTQPAATDGEETGESLTKDCTACHATQGEAWLNFSSHQAIFSCAFCHEEATPATGAGHRTYPACNDCHSEAAHPAAIGGADTDRCLKCHDPHGSQNLFLIRETIRTTQGKEVSIDFRNIQGKADYSYAEKGQAEGGTNGLEPGAGLCEVCHARTSVYNRTGTGDRHYGGRCAGCHSHADSFRAEPH